MTCRFCGFGVFAAIPCPGDGDLLVDGQSALSNGGASSALTMEDLGGMGSLPVIIASFTGVLALCICCWYRRRLRKRRAPDATKEKPVRDNFYAQKYGEATIGTPRSLDEPEELTKWHGGALDLTEKHEEEKKTEQHLLEVSELADVLDGAGSIVEWSRVRFERMLDEGCIGKCYRVSLKEDDEEGRHFVLRRLGIDALNVVPKLDWAERAAELRSLDSHPLFLHTIGFATDGGHNFGIVTETMPNSLDKILMKAETNETIASKLRIGWPQLSREIAGGLAALHSIGVAHLSLHPGNVLLDGHTRVKLSDYALPTELIRKRRELFQAMAAPSGLCEEHQLYEAPELLRAEVGVIDEVDEQYAPSDIWSLGCIIIRILTLEPLYIAAAPRDETWMSQSKSMLNRTLPRIASGVLHPAANLEDAFHPWHPDEPAVMPLAMDLIHRCTDIEPANRPSADEVAGSLGSDIQHELHVHKKIAQPDAVNVRQIAAASLPAPVDRFNPAAARRTHVEKFDSVMSAAFERQTVRDALGLSAEGDVGAPSPHHALLGGSTDSNDESVDSACEAQDAVAYHVRRSEAHAGRAAPQRLAPRRRQVRPQQPQVTEQARPYVAEELEDDEGTREYLTLAHAPEPCNAGRIAPRRLPPRRRESTLAHQMSQSGADQNDNDAAEQAAEEEAIYLALAPNEAKEGLSDLGTLMSKESEQDEMFENLAEAKTRKKMRKPALLSPGSDISNGTGPSDGEASAHREAAAPALQLTEKSMAMRVRI